jgi:predicted dithiol-disulfide oxidoreductase (DUF899 family)
MNEVETLQEQIAGLHEKLVEARRRQAPEPVSDYELKTPEGRPVMLSALFGDKPELILIHNMGRRCPYCTLWADGFNGVAEHLADRASFVLTSPDSPPTLKEFAASRGWRFRTASISGTTFAKDLGYEPEPGKFWPGVSVFRKEPGGRIVRTARDVFGPGDFYCPVWHLFDLLPEGAHGWQPKFTYTS